MSLAARFSYFFLFSVIVLTGVLHLATPLLTVLFSYFVICRFHFIKQKWVAVALFLVVVCGVVYGLGFLAVKAVDALPRIASETIPSIIAFARKYDVELPFSDVETLKAALMDTMKDEFRIVGTFARGATKQFVFIVIGIVVAVSLRLNPHLEGISEPGRPSNLFTSFTSEIVLRFGGFYRSFETVMGGQLLISSINTILTALFVLAINLRHGAFAVGLTFLCGLLPIIGNLISNTIITGIAFTASPKMALAALAFLVAVHKLEYFLNSKIIGHRIKNPVWLTLLALVLGERLMGIPGMILAPVVLDYIRVEASRLPSADAGTAN